MKIKFYNPNNDLIPLELRLIVDDKYSVYYTKDITSTTKLHPTYIFNLIIENNIKMDYIHDMMIAISNQIIEQSKVNDENWTLLDFEILTIDMHTCKFKLIFDRE